MREGGPRRSERDGESRPETRPLPERERALEGEEREERRERVAAPLDAVEDRQRKDRVQRGREEARVGAPEPLSDEDEERQVQERRDEREEPHDDVPRARSRERQEQRVRREVVERRAGVDAERREDLRDISGAQGSV